MRHTTAVIIGGGQAGLAMSHSLGERGIDHVILERGRIAQSWHGRWLPPAERLKTRTSRMSPGCRRHPA